jgi:hypothetical protein
LLVVLLVPTFAKGIAATDANVKIGPLGMTAFRPMSADDLPTIKRWPEASHVSAWWHDPAEQFELVRGDVEPPDMAQFIVAADGRECAGNPVLREGRMSARSHRRDAGRRGALDDPRAVTRFVTDRFGLQNAACSQHIFNLARWP